MSECFPLVLPLDYYYDVSKVTPFPRLSLSVGALTQLADRLSGPFNVETVVLPLDISISDAIMNFQDNGFNVAQDVFKACGQPKMYSSSRRRREASPAGGDRRGSERAISMAGAGSSSQMIPDDDAKGHPKMLKTQSSGKRKSEFEKMMEDLRRTVRTQAHAHKTYSLTRGLPAYALITSEGKLPESEGCI